MRQVFYQLWVLFLKIILDIKAVRHPLWVVYGLVGFNRNGWQKLQALGELQPGETVLSGYSRLYCFEFIIRNVHRNQLSKVTKVQYSKE